MSFDRATRRGLTAAAVLLAALASTSFAGAASPADRAAARQHLSQAEGLMKKGQVAEACKHLEEVERLDPQLPTLIELAECSEQAGKLVEAQAQWAAARDRAKHDEKPQSRAKAETRLASVQKRIAHLTLQLAPSSAGAQVLRDDVALEPSALASALPMNPGEHVIVVKLAGHDDAKYAVKLTNGDNQSLSVAVGPATGSQSSSPAPPPALLPSAPAPSPSPSLAAPAAAEPTPQEAPTATGWWSGERKAGAILGAAGVVAIGVGTALCVLGNRDANKSGSIADPRLALGAMSLATGGVLFVTGVALEF